MEVLVDVLERRQREPVQDVGDAGAAERRRHVELPGAVSLQLEDVADDDLDTLEVLIRMDVAAVGGDEDEDDSHEEEDPVNVPDLPP